MKSWKTTMGGIVAAIMLALPEICDALGVEVAGHTDGTFQFTTVAAAGGILWALFKAKDKDEDEKPEAGK